MARPNVAKNGEHHHSAHPVPDPQTRRTEARHRVAGRNMVAAPPDIDNVMVKALALAHRWRKLLETGAYGTVDEIAAGNNPGAAVDDLKRSPTLPDSNGIEAELRESRSERLDRGRLCRERLNFPETHLVLRESFKYDYLYHV